MLEFFVNGVSVGTMMIDISMFGAKEVYEFNFLIVPSFIFEAPVNIRVREVETGEEIGEPLVFQGIEETRAAIVIADGAVVGVERGSLKGRLSDVNSDALPITIAAYSRGAPIARTVVGSKAAAPAPGGLISLLPFSIGLPPSILDGGSTSISVRIDGSPQEFVGSPLVIRLDAGDGLHDRLNDLEQRNQRLETEVMRLRASIVSDIADQFYRFVVPRVDALLAIQREGLEGQMVALWHEMGADHPAPIVRRKLPPSVSLSLKGPFTGFGWSEPIPERPSDRWFAGTGFVATEISAKNDLLLVARGGLAVAPGARERLSIFANGRKIEAKIHADGEGWLAVGLVPRAGLSENGALALVFETPVAGLHPLAPEALGAVSLSLAEVQLTGLEATGSVYAVGEPASFPLGWHTLEETPNYRFRWMGAEGLVVVTGLESGEPIELVVNGPMTLADALSHMTAELDGVRARSSRVETHEHGWTLRLEFPARGKDSLAAALLCLRAPAKRPSAMDPRLLSVAVSEVAITPKLALALKLATPTPPEAEAAKPTPAVSEAKEEQELASLAPH